ncbi:uncharacterized protein LOC132200700 [Neocloeon triangulifer]|uniref:uncharacterized protein LOC132200700 n=1 Tax=Neocloeon triangulifer TaxID=2078957 RepID=UPI00286F60DC|nr:uncharacterized protein LOC132200700 [Neocloeon triangulifer]XP_059482348.1 uncharacterized protein LOC132200700 [Neocloeon triangulifer]
MDVVTIDTVLNADCVAWCPRPDRQNLLLCSTYQLVDQKRTGSLLLFETAPEVHLIQTVLNLSGIFDFKWSPAGQDLVMVAAVDSEGQIHLFKLDIETNLLHLVSALKISDAFALYVDWLDSKLAVSFADGTVSIFEINSDGLNCVQNYKNHSLEAWTTVFDVNEPEILYSGGDDSVMILYDTKSECVISKNRYHTAGVTHFMTCKQHPYNFISGSYDELICLWDKRQTRRPVKELGLGGGVWRIQSEIGVPTPKLAVACMFKGFLFLELNSEGFIIDNRFRNEEGCLAYGVGLAQDNRVAMCTFYDHLLNVSRRPVF